MSSCRVRRVRQSSLAATLALLAVAMVLRPAWAAEVATSPEIEKPAVSVEDAKPMALPKGSSRGAEGGAAGLEVGGRKVAMDHLGPVVVNSDGTISRITNWDTLSARERETALRRISKRNNERKEQLLQADKLQAELQLATSSKMKAQEEL